MNILGMIMFTFLLLIFFKWILNLVDAHIKVEHLEYVKVLDYETWKEPEKIQDEMQELYRGWLNQDEVTTALLYLQRNDIIEDRQIPYIVPGEPVRFIPQFKLKKENGGKNEPLLPPLGPSHSKSRKFHNFELV